MPPTSAKFAPELMDKVTASAVMDGILDLIDTNRDGVADNLDTYWPSAFNALKQGDPIPISEIEIVVVPLDRIGAPAGASGSKVYISYFCHNRQADPTWAPSPPLVVKIGDHKSLQEEFSAWSDWPKLGPNSAEAFAFPIRVKAITEDLSLLVATFKSEFSMDSDGKRLKVAMKDLWRILHDKGEIEGKQNDKEEEIEKIVGSALDSLSEAHRNLTTEFPRDQLNYRDQYEWYLRGTVGCGQRAHIPKSLFGTGETVSAFGRTWSNPVQVVEKALEMPPFEGCVGAVHGDLHPKNIVLNNNNNVRIIDFGWAKKDQHVIVDHLLLDINLRSTTLPSQISVGDALELASFLDLGADPDRLPSSVRSRGKIIKTKIWETASSKICFDWDREYLIPMLLVSYGLIVYLDDVRNQTAFVSTVLTLSDRVKPLVEEA